MRENEICGASLIKDILSDKRLKESINGRN